MAFRITARTLLELGAELISSDAVAIYELVKNALDAGSPTVAIHVQVVLRRSVYQEALDAIAARTPPSEVIAELRRQVVDGAPADARGRLLDGLARHVEDRIRFRRELKRLYQQENWIKVTDAGSGMSLASLQDDFLTIGTRSRRREKVSRLGKPLEGGRGLLGEKGVGRLSTMRLGDHLTVVTSTARDSHWNELHIDWNRFSHESDAYLEDVAISPVMGARKASGDTTGTTILVSALKGDWDVGVFRKMADDQFRRIVDPLPPDPGTPPGAVPPDPNELFDLRFNGKVQDLEGVPAWLLQRAHAVVRARYDVTEAGPTLSGTIDYLLRGKSRTFQYIETELTSLTDPISDRAIRSSPRVLRELGPFSMTLYWYNRRVLTEVEVETKKYKRGEVIAAVNEWSGGLMVFRNGFRINPYGSGDDDWLELDKKALGASGYKVNRAQIIGRVALTSLNHRLVEQTNREGLADNEFKQALVGMLRFVLITEFRTFITDVDKKRKVRELTTTEELNARIDRTRDDAERTILELLKAVPEQRSRLDSLRTLISEIGKLMQQVRQLSDEFEDDKAKLTQLAGIGLMVEFILHEIGRATGRALEVMSDIDRRGMDPGGASALRTLEDQLRTLRKRVDNLDPLSTSRRQVQEVVDVAEVIGQVVSGRAAQFERHGIEVRAPSIDRPWRVKCIRGMLIGILENLVENAVYWLKTERRVDRHFRPILTFDVDPLAEEIRVTDNGPGVAAERAETIFEPFVTAKPTGQGRGLGLYIARDMARPHGWTLDMADIEGERPGRLNTFVLHLGKPS